MLVDSHCHLDRVDLSPYDGDFERFVAETRRAGIGHMLCVCIDLEHYDGMRALVEDYDAISVSVGVHPNEKERHEPDVEELAALATDPRVVAVGETGLDYFREEGSLEWQQERFRTHIRAARAVGKPLIVHSRDARDDTLRILAEEGAGSVGGVMHCFTETWEMARAAMNLGFLISFSGIVTFRNAGNLRDVARRVPLDNLLIETDSPYLAPVPHRGRSNEPRFVGEVARQIGELHGLNTAVVAEKTRKNFFSLFPQATKTA
jgi:TatD DNase family protein